MKPLTTSGIRLGIVLLLLAIASCVLVFNIRTDRIKTEQQTVTTAQ